MLNPKLKSVGKQRHCKAEKTNNNGQTEIHREKKHSQKNINMANKK